MAKFKVPVTRTYTKSMEYEVIADNADEALKIVSRDRGRKILMEGEFEEESSEFGDPEEIKETETEETTTDFYCKVPTRDDTLEFLNRTFHESVSEGKGNPYTGQLLKRNQYSSEIETLISQKSELEEYCYSLCTDTGIRPAELTIELLSLDLFDAYLSHEV